MMRTTSPSAQNAESAAPAANQAEATNVDTLKAKGNAAFREARYADAIQAFSDALELEPTSHVLLSNRSAAYASEGNYTAALDDAKKCVDVAPEWVKGYSRLAAAHHGLNDLTAALEAVERGLAVDPNNAMLLKSRDEINMSFASANTFDRQSQGDVENVFTKALREPNLWVKLATDPRTAALVKNEEFCKKMTLLQQNPSLVNGFLKDPNIISALFVLMDVDMKADQTGSAGAEAEATSSFSSSSTSTSFESKAKAKPTAAPQQPAAPKPTESEEQKQVRELRELGNASYKARNFEEALKNYNAAFELPLGSEDPTLLSNIAAVYFEMKDYQNCVEYCNRAVELAHKVQADFSVAAKALARAGRAYEAAGELDLALAKYQESLIEKRNPDVVVRMQAIEKAKVVAAREAYRDVAKSDEARERGNKLFAESKYAEAVKEYNEAVLRNNNDARAYANRSACFHKLGALPDALRDAESCIKLDPNYLKGYVRKINTQMLARDLFGARSTCHRARAMLLARLRETVKQNNATEEADIKRQLGELNELLMRVFDMVRERNKRARTDANARKDMSERAQENVEVRAMLQEPAMLALMRELESNPEAAQSRLQDPQLAVPIVQLYVAGILDLGDEYPRMLELAQVAKEVKEASATE